MLIHSNDVKIKIVCLGNNVYYREKSGDYEVEMFAKTEEDLKRRLVLLDLLETEELKTAQVETTIPDHTIPSTTGEQQ